MFRAEKFRAGHAGMALLTAAFFTAALFTLVPAAPAAAQEAVPAQPGTLQPADARPNIVIILADDVALMDFGVFGGEARTPNIDALARRGMIFTHAYTSPMCAPSRAMLLTGIDSHKAGVGNLPEFLPPEHQGQRAYSGHLVEGVETLAARLKPLGYRAYVTGKWHLGHGPGQLPDSHGFDRSFVLDASGADNWEQRAYLPGYADDLWFEDGRKARRPDGVYSSKFLVDRMISYLDEGDPQQPFLAYLAFQAVHIPVQAPGEFTARYKGIYDAGWDEIRTRRWQRAQELGLVPEGAPLAPPHPDLRRWDSLSADERALMARSMEVNAGMLEAMDHEIGRFVDHLRATGQFDNTIFVVTSDNGPEPNDPGSSAMMRFWMWATGYTRELEDLGEQGSYAWIGPEWASAAAGPSRLFKLYSANGGLRVPLIFSGPGVPRQGRTDAFTFVTDIAPTLLELAGADVAAAPGEAPPSEVPITGRSLAPVLKGEAARAHPPGAGVGMEAAGQSAYFQDNWKLVRTNAPFGDGVWRLYDISVDPGETRDLAQAEPARFAQMRAAYDAWAEENGVLPVPEGYTAVGQMLANYMATLRARFWWVPVALVGLAAAAWLGWRRRRAGA